MDILQIIAYWWLQIGLVLTLLYWFLMRMVAKQWLEQPTVKLDPTKIPETSISVLIPARNEAANIERCLTSIAQQNYPSHLIEVIVIDDHSTDNTDQLAAHTGAKVVSLKDHLPQGSTTNAYKKAAQQLGIEQSSGDLIVCTDADTWHHENWLAHLAQAYETENLAFIAAPVLMPPTGTWLQRFQAFDFVGMMVLTAVGWFSHRWRLANGANLAFAKADYQQLPLRKITDQTLASGDDMDLAQAFYTHFYDRCTFVKSQEAAVFTDSETTFSNWWQQRLRWATKNGKTTDKGTTKTLLLAFATNFMLLTSCALIWLSPKILGTLFVLQLFLKLLADWQLQSVATDFFDQKKLRKQFFSSSLFHSVYIVVVGVVSRFRKRYIWKERVAR